LGSCLPVHCWLRKHEDVEVVVLVADAVWDRDERRVIADQRRYGQLLNCTAGGDGVSNPTAATRAKMRAAKLGKPLSLEHCARLSASKRGQKKPPHREETKARIANALRGSKSHTAKLTESKVREIKRLLATGRVADVSRQTGVSYGRVYAIANGWNWSHVHG
jgi:hypothetical protein